MIASLLLHYLIHTVFSQQKDTVLISVVVPIFNSAQFLRETINSVLYQTLDFEENIELILVDDGSTDNSREICELYVKKYPNNIHLFRQDHSGVSIARNHGLQHARGIYVNFLDSDDCWMPAAFERMMTFFSKAGDAVDVVAGRMQYFDRWAFFHPLDYKFTSTRVINLNNSFDCIQLHVSSSLIRRSAMTDTFFSPNLQFGEDAQFLNTIILKKCQIGVVKEAIHLYRRRNSGNSALQVKTKSIAYYTTTLSLYYQYLFDASTQKYGVIMKFIQFIFMYDFQYRMREPSRPFLTQEQYNTYYVRILKQLSQIDDDVILALRSMPQEHKDICISGKKGPANYHSPLYFLLAYGNVSETGGLNKQNNSNTWKMLCSLAILIAFIFTWSKARGKRRSLKQLPF